MIDTVSEAQRINWKQATDLNVYEFLNTLCYTIDKARHREKTQKEAYEKIRSKHHH